MNPTDLQPKTELAYGTGITVVSLVLNWVSANWLDAINITTVVATCVGALCGAIVGIHAVYRINRPKKRLDRRAADKE